MTAAQSGGAAAELETVVRIATDGVWVVFSYDCEDPTPQFPDKRSYVRDALSVGDKVELFLEPNRGSRIYIHFKISPAGEQFDQQCTLTSREPTRDAYFNPHWRCAGARTARGWAIEALAPDRPPVQRSNWTRHYVELRITAGPATWPSSCPPATAWGW